MAVSPLFQTDFARAGSPLEGVLGTFMDINIKEGKARQARELKAADPKGFLDIYKEALKNERELMKQLTQLRSKSTGGDTISTSFTAPNELAIIKEENRIKDQQRRQLEDKQAGAGAYDAARSRVRQTLKRIKDADPDTRESLAGQLRGDIQRARMSAAGQTRGAGHAIHEGMLQDAADLRLPREAMRVVFQESAVARIIPTDEDKLIYQNPQQLSPSAQAALNRARRGTSTSRRTTKTGTEGVDPSSLAKMLMNQLAVAKAETRRARSQYDQARTEYRRLAGGPDRNLAFAPIATRPSQQSAALDEYTRLVEVDPERAAAVLDASREAGEFTIGDRLAELRADPDAKGKAPIDTVLDQVGALEALTGYSRGPAEPGKFGVSVITRNLSAADIPTVRQAMADMLAAVDAPMYAGQKFGKIDSMGDTLEFRNYLENGIAALDELEKDDPSVATQVAEDFAKELVDWKDSQDESEIKRQRADNQPGFAVSRSINRIRTAKRKADKSGDKKILQQALADETNKIRATDDFSRSAYGDRFLEDVEEFLDHQDVDYFENNLIELQSAAEEAAVIEPDMDTQIPTEM
ncbi:MAG: hypothetical protein CMN21_24975 [Rubinisphaera sp.]|uniref:hypothetical protein n=1 Tax=Rubinisphaera sp. TaxID=2024857 RepID=UPI000C0EDDF7|nr:hypothetical protein [Rubinisphaera sp.]MBV12459.1 hypothetical protein [Rubinisphaera sp.]